MSDITTEAGKRLWMPDFEVSVIEEMGREWPTAYTVSKWERNAIGERRFTGESRTYEARAATLARVRERVEAMPVCVSTGDDLFDNLPLEDWNRDLFLMLDRAAVLAILEEEE